MYDISLWRQRNATQCFIPTRGEVPFPILSSASRAYRIFSVQLSRTMYFARAINMQTGYGARRELESNRRHSLSEYIDRSVVRTEGVV